MNEEKTSAKKRLSPAAVKLIIAAAVILLCIAAYIFIIQPYFVSSGFYKPFEFNGISYYEEDYYKSFNNGEIFEEYLAECFDEERCEVVDFFYFDNQRGDSIIFGDMLDVFLLECNALPEFIDYVRGDEKFSLKGKQYGYSFYSYDRGDELTYFIACTDSKLFFIMVNSKDFDPAELHTYINDDVFKKTTG